MTPREKKREIPYQAISNHERINIGGSTENQKNVILFGITGHGGGGGFEGIVFFMSRDSVFDPLHSPRAILFHPWSQWNFSRLRRKTFSVCVKRAGPLLTTNRKKSRISVNKYGRKKRVKEKEKEREKKNMYVCLCVCLYVCVWKKEIPNKEGHVIKIAIM